MKKKFAALLGLLAILPTSASAYLSQDGTRLANGSGKCAVCATGWVSTGNNSYKCNGEVTTVTNCRPAAAHEVVGGPPPTLYDDKGVKLLSAQATPAMPTRDKAVPQH